MTYTNSIGEPNVIDYLRMLERRLARLERGTQGSSGGDDSTVIVSLNITGLSLTTQTVVFADDSHRVMMRYSWTAIPDDPSEYNKDRLDGYLSSWSINGINFTADRFTTDNTIDVGPFTQGQSVTFRVRARTVKGTIGNYSSITNSTTTDSTAPFQPSTPTVVPYLGQLRITWNGLDVSSNATPTDFRFAEVHLSTTGPTFTPTIATLVGTLLRGGGAWVATDLTYGVTYYCRLVAVDTVGNKSPATTAASAIPEQLVNADMGPNSIATANIQNLAVNNAKIADLSVGKLTAGTLTADMTVSARIKTADSGTRVELNVNGLQAFNAGGQTVSISALSGSATIVGSFHTAFSGSGTPFITIQDSSSQSTIFFRPAAGSNNAFINSFADGSGVPRLRMVTGAFTYLGLNSTMALYLSTTTGITLGVNATATNNRVGFYLSLDESFMSLQRTSSANALTGGSFEASDTAFWIRRYGGGILNGGQVTSSTNNLWLQAIASGTVNAELRLDDDGIWNLVGRLINNNAFSNDPNDLIIAGTTSAGDAGGTSHPIVYGATVPARPGVVYSIFTTTNTEHRLSSFSTTGFTVTTGVAAVLGMQYWAWRV